MRSFEETTLVFRLSIDMAATGKRICELLEASGLTREEVMDSLGLSSAQTFWKWEHGRSIPSTDNLMRLSVLLDVPVDQLLVVHGREQARSTLHPEQHLSPGDRSRFGREKSGRDIGNDSEVLPDFFIASLVHYIPYTSSTMLLRYIPYRFSMMQISLTRISIC